MANFIVSFLLLSKGTAKLWCRNKQTNMMYMIFLANHHPPFPSLPLGQPILLSHSWSQVFTGSGKVSLLWVSKVLASKVLCFESIRKSFNSNYSAWMKTILLGVLVTVQNLQNIKYNCKTDFFVVTVQCYRTEYLLRVINLPFFLMV